ncbi:L-2-amino-thiazoline-4-carboxylic acid hydrolase [Clostridium sp. chh4-2]|uniref:L-2-amino-thiazoline-4-carboxylic acid hydrolase n=1 Tax=Clostridium sp. chh4-2 TaxID=2067550 RepID=UPI0015E1A07F|nr:L-2-amino-thiazoline-4-carboxylic acid hydrolase [Clostridium sp. chh4-2]
MEITGRDFTVEHHAVLYALMAKQIMLFDPAQGEVHVLAATGRYGEDRGKRMARAALKDGCGLNPCSYMVYGELPLVTGASKSSSSVEGGRFRTSVSGCGWLDAWKKYDLADYGAFYCKVIDESVYRGFNPELELKISSCLSGGDEACGFDWGEAVSQEEQQRCQEFAEKLGTGFRKDFLFHTSGMLAVMGEYLKEAYGNHGNEIVERALEEFSRIFGREYAAILEKETR